MRLYFKRSFYAHYDAPRDAPWNAFASKADEIDFAVVRPENTKKVAKHFPRLRLAATVFTEITDAPILLVYARDYEEPPTRISAQAGAKTYAESFPHFCAN
jgi:selenophosphate synthetase-related protein